MSDLLKVKKLDKLPVISRQIDTDVYLTVDGDRVSVKDYEERKTELEQGDVVVSDGEHLARNSEAEKRPTGDTVRDGLEPEDHPSATAPGATHGSRVANDKFSADVKNEGQVEDSEANETDEKRANQITESTPAMTVQKTGVAVEDQDGSNVATEAANVAPDTSRVNPEALVENMKETPGGLHPTAKEPDESDKDGKNDSQKDVNEKNAKVAKDAPKTETPVAQQGDNNAANDAKKNAEKKADIL